MPAYVDAASSPGRKKLLLLLFSILLFAEVRAQDVFSAGPMLHYNFGDKKPKLSWGIEAAVWWYEDGFPISANIGFDRRKGSTILYTQAQTGIAVAGLSVGPYLELRKEEPTVLGLQTDYWINNYLGLNYRIRYGGGQKQKALGGYVKLPVSLIPEEEREDGDWDWDWD
ncbi:hypothetical protein [Pontibacter ruber]|uniref:Uncharacterized protein n=1 Tax=Pontibacter ruber TaxID=1343895 RepID=A0ABW5D3X3_9BACT|nr:hypothetical protein [Pontibacter ruber]